MLGGGDEGLSDARCGDLGRNVIMLLLMNGV